MSDWWNSITPLEQFFWYITIPFSVAFIFKSILSFIGMSEHGEEGDMEHNFEMDDGGDAQDLELEIEMESDIEAEMDVEHAEVDEIEESDSAGFHLLTIRNFIIFFAVFGWAGIAGIHFGFPPIVTFIFAFFMAFATILIVASIFYYIYKLTESGTLNIKSVINSTGTVYLQIPPNKEGVGKVNIAFADSIREFDAMTEGEFIATGDSVIVLGVTEEGVLLVEKWEDLNTLN